MTTTTSSTTSSTTTIQRQRTDARPAGDPVRLRLGAAAMVAGLLGQLPLGALHPHREYANDSAAAFHEYAHSDDWVLVHLGQYLGVLLVAIGLLTLASALARQRGLAGFLGGVAGATAVVAASVFAVQMAVDGIALKAAVDAWVASGTTEHETAYRVADSVRSAEKGLSALFSLTNGITMLSLGAALALTPGRGRWLGWVAAAAGLGLATLGVITARTGFSHEADTLTLPTMAALAVFTIGTAVNAWRRTDR